MILAQLIGNFQGVISTVVLLWLINLIVPIRMDPNEELMGADLCEHKIKHGSVSHEFLLLFLIKSINLIHKKCIYRLEFHEHFRP